MIHTNNPIIKHKAGLLNLAEELGNVSRACKVMGVSRDTFYRYRELAEHGGVDALINRSRRSPNLKNRTDIATEPVMNSRKKLQETVLLSMMPKLLRWKRKPMMMRHVARLKHLTQVI